ncbi:ADP-ribosylglycohydrolase family protein [Actinorugispora endophytica]|uniref:ADP-ribosylglycohydrolase n=1 Tax=Actinorugispora endophytica TaxID=1605990 RepID=A0A4V3D8F2_9ACTN|nr:ADP-ribosylglycohydrolase family protein [Actinorugispora endophytica]TDQ51547.1 ADP-ribosylglycohydrolase [Actinorugispora endophytica]
MNTVRTRALAALHGLAIGDALGMPTQLLSRSDITGRFGSIEGFEDGPADHPIAPGMRAGTVTDDTEQALLVARLLIEGDGHIAPDRFAVELALWEKQMAAKGSADLLGPSTKRAIEAIAAGDSPLETGKYGTTNGAAMRIAPVGVATPHEPLDGLLDRVVEAGLVTHNTGLGIASAAAVAATVSAGVAGAGVGAALDAGQRAAEAGAVRGHWVAGGDMAARIAWARAHVVGRPEAEVLDFTYDVIGTSVASQESVVAAFALAQYLADDPWKAVRLAAGLGGDTDTVAAILGAMLGACHGTGAFPAEAVTTVREVNGIDFESLADDLLALRGR